MNKIYNNLSIENLKKTEWFNQFNNKQKKQIRLGLLSNLDISWYAKKEFNWRQMEEIKSGLYKKIDISIYAKEYFNWRQMEQIRLGLEDNLDVSIYVNSKLNWNKMQKIRLDFKYGKMNFFDFIKKIINYFNKNKQREKLENEQNI